MISDFAVVFALYPRVTQLDFTGPFEIFARLPRARCVLASTDGGTIQGDGGITFSGVERLADVTDCALLCVPGGFGTVAAMESQAFLSELRRLATRAQFVTSVCTGSLLLAAASRQESGMPLGLARAAGGFRRHPRSRPNRARWQCHHRRRSDCGHRHGAGRDGGDRWGRLCRDRAAGLGVRTRTAVRFRQTGASAAANPGRRVAAAGCHPRRTFRGRWASGGFAAVTASGHSPSRIRQQALRRRAPAGTARARCCCRSAPPRRFCSPSCRAPATARPAGRHPRLLRPDAYR